MLRLAPSNFASGSVLYLSWNQQQEEKLVQKLVRILRDRFLCASEKPISTLVYEKDDPLCIYSVLCQLCGIYTTT